MKKYIILLILCLLAAGCGKKKTCLKSHKETRIVRVRDGHTYGYGWKITGGWGFGLIPKYKDVEQEVDVCDVWSEK